MKVINMPQIKISLDDENAEFVSNFKEYGYSSKSAIVDDAVKRLHRELMSQALRESAELYQQIYQEDLELQELTDSAASSCLE